MDLQQFIAKAQDHLKPLYKKHWHTIKYSFKRGIIRDTYHFPLLAGTDREITTKLNTVLTNYKDPIKMNCAFGFALRERVTDELRFYHPSNNNMMFETARLIRNPEDKKKLNEEIEQIDGLEYARAHRPSTKWVVDGLMCIRFDVFKLQ